MTLRSGTRLGPYEISALLGSGGMAEVYRARDMRLGREVAIKILPDEISGDEDALLRFEREAKTASALNHPHLVTIHDIGEATADGRQLRYIAMELIRGETLRYHLQHQSRDVLLRYLADIADGLAKAHDAGVLHRDLKPENVMVTDDDYAKVVDFGLAKRLEGFASGRSAEHLTEEGFCVGTPGYMAPEQVRGQRDLDGRTDIFALGCILYEALAKENPFDGDSSIDTLHRVLYHEPPPLPDAAMDTIVRRCLAKDRSFRYSSMREVAADLRSVMASSPANAVTLISASRRAVIASIAVLPFRNSTGNEEMRFLSDGIPEDVVRNLGRIPSLRVIASSSASRFRDTADPQHAARELNVDAVLVGGLRLMSGMVLLDAELVRAADGTALWGKKYRRQLTDLVALEEEIARDLCEELRVEIAPRQQRAPHPEAYEAYLRGKREVGKETSEGLKTGVEFFHRAIEIDPDYALPYAALALVHGRLGLLGIIPTRTAVAQEVALAKKALSLDELLPEAHWNLALAAGMTFDAAEHEKRMTRVLELNPNFAPAYIERTKKFVLTERYAEGESAYQYARVLDPLSPRAMTAYAAYLSTMGRYEHAVPVLRSATEQFPEYANAWAYLAIISSNAGLVEESMATIGRMRTDANANYEVWKGIILAQAGHLAEAREVAERTDEVAKSRYLLTYYRAWLRGKLGDHDQAFALMDQGIRDGEWYYGWLAVEPRFDPLRSDPRFERMLEKRAASLEHATA
jgi:serine/threonine protein kinase/Tfp pilus assembly protein PilF